jgi:hypothetical protein
MLATVSSIEPQTCYISTPHTNLTSALNEPYAWIKNKRKIHVLIKYCKIRPIIYANDAKSTRKAYSMAF